MYSETLTDINYNKLQTDFRAEAVAINLIKYERKVNYVFLQRLGNNDRSYLKDIKSISNHYLGLDEEAYVIESFREGIYDYLPEGIFHPPSLGGTRKNIDSVVNEMRRQKQIEKDARKFFQPFELEIFYTEMNAMLMEDKFDVASHPDNLLHVLDDLWPFLGKLDAETAQIFIYILPFFHQIKGSKKWFEKCLTAFLKVPVEVTFVPNVIDGIQDMKSLMMLGNTKLGIDFVLGGSHMDGERNWQVNIGPIPYDQVQKYTNQHPFRGLLQAIYENFLPVTVKIEENFITEKEALSFVLDDENQNANRLNFTTFI